MAIDYVRGGNPRCPSLLVGGLMLVCLFFACSWWSLTSQNFELLSQITDLEEQMKIGADELEKCTQSKLAMDEKAKSFQNSAAQQRVKIEQLKAAESELQETLKTLRDDVNNANRKLASLESSLNLKNTELESLKRLDEAKNKTLEALRTEKKTLVSKLQEEQTKVESLVDELNKKKPISDPVASYVKGNIKLDENKPSVGITHDQAHAQDEDNIGGEDKADGPEQVAPLPDNGEAAMKQS